MTEMSAALLRHREPLAWTIAIAAAIGTGFAARNHLEGRSEEARRAADARYRPTPVVVAREDLPPGTELRAGRLAVRSMPADFLPSSVVREPQAPDLLGRSTQYAVRAGEPIQLPLLRPRNSERLAERIALGRRAVTIVVDEAAAAAGLMSPGDRIDLLWRGASAPALQNVAVIATGRQYLPAAQGSEESIEYATLTLELPDADARRIAAADSGDLRVLLRNPIDTGVVALPPVATATGRTNEPPVTLFVGGHGGPVPVVQLLAAGAP